MWSLSKTVSSKSCHKSIVLAQNIYGFDIENIKIFMSTDKIIEYKNL